MRQGDPPDSDSAHFVYDEMFLHSLGREPPVRNKAFRWGSQRRLSDARSGIHTFLLHLMSLIPTDKFGAARPI